MPIQSRSLFFRHTPATMRRPKLIYQLLYAGIVLLCIVSCWNARLLYTAKDGTIPAKHVEFVKSVMGQRDTLFDTVNLLKQKCSGSGQDSRSSRGHPPSRNSSCNKPQLWSQHKDVDFEKSLVLGYKKKEPGFLTIGIPTVLRESESYLSNTLDSLIDNTTPEERAEITLLIFLADLEEEKRHALKTLLMDRYMDHLEGGLIQVIQAPPTFYPPLENLKENFGDKPERVRWRSKQVVDFAFMFLYARGLSDYYMQIEDDVITTAGYVSAIQDYIAEKNDVHWVTLEFSVLGFIGKMFRDYDLDRLAQFIMFFYEDQPVDFLYKYFMILNGQSETYLRAPTLFQHKGKQSSLKDKVMDVQDRFFETDQRQFRDSTNPAATVYSSMKAFGSYNPQLSYEKKEGYFWAVRPQEGDSVVVVFDAPTVITRIAVATGSANHPSDTVDEASLELSPMLLRRGDIGLLPECSDYVEIGRFGKGRIDVHNVPELFPDLAACLRIRILKSQPQWVVFKEIAVWTSK